MISVIETTEAGRKSIREERLKQYSDFAKMDQLFQKKALDGIDSCVQYLEESKQFRLELMVQFKILTDHVQRQNTVYLV